MILFLNMTALWLALPCPSLNAQNEAKPQKRDVARLDKDCFIGGFFKEKMIMVTGLARSIGKWTAMRAVKEGANVVIIN